LEKIDEHDCITIAFSDTETEMILGALVVDFGRIEASRACPAPN
jgi:hypothetical protein